MKTTTCKICGDEFSRPTTSSLKYCTPECRIKDSTRIDPVTGCQLWIRAERRGGYGGFWHVEDGEKKFVNTHRYVYEQLNGPVPHGLVIRHKCDRQPCCNPAHLEIGTQGDNVRDCVKRGRHPIGRLVEFAGRKQSFRQWAEELGIPKPTVYWRYKQGRPLTGGK